jgi:beta-lactamase regulating signal transducer with metallopeptidase domain
MMQLINQFAEGWFSWQVSMLWQAGLLIAIVAMIDLLIKRWAWPQVRYALWMLILVKLVLPPSLTSPISFTAEVPFAIEHLMTKINKPQISQQTVEKQAEIALPSLPEAGKARNDEILRFAQNDNRAQNDVAVPAAKPPATSKQLITWKVYVMFVWLGGAGILTGWLVMRLRGLRREHLESEQILPERLEELLAATAKKLNLRRIPQVILTDRVCCPAVFGVFRPVLLMPAKKLANMTMQDAENVFLHELAHIKRGDLFVHAIYMVLQIAYWFNPLVWLARKPMQNLRELCCDATVARMLKERTAGYRQTLLETARELLAVPVEPGLGLLGLFENSSWLLDRLHWLEKKSWKYRPLRIATIFILICLMSACVLPMSKFHPAPDFVIKGTVTDAQTGKPIAGAIVGDVVSYAYGKYNTTTDANGNYSYKTYYEEHILKCRAAGYKDKTDILLVKLLGKKEKEKVMDFQLDKKGISTQEHKSKENKKQQGDFSIKLSNGTTVELVGVCEHPSKDKQWWAPDGNMLEKNPYDEINVSIASGFGRQAIEAAVQISNYDENYDVGFRYQVEDAKNSGSGECRKENRNLAGLYSLVFDQPKNSASSKIKLGIASGSWMTLQTKEADFHGVYSKMPVIWHEPTENGGKTIINTAHTKSEMNVRVIAIDKSGSEYAGSSSSGWENDFESVQTEFSLPLSDIKEFKFQVRPYDWVEFKNVSLKSGLKTDVQTGAVEKVSSGTDEKGQYRNFIRKEKLKAALENPEIIKDAAKKIFEKIKNADYDKILSYYDNGRWKKDGWQKFDIDYTVLMDWPNLTLWICRTFKDNPITTIELGRITASENDWPQVEYKLTLKDSSTIEGNLPFEYHFFDDETGRWYGIHGIDWHLQKNPIKKHNSKTDAQKSAGQEEKD